MFLRNIGSHTDYRTLYPRIWGHSRTTELPGWMGGPGEPEGGSAVGIVGECWSYLSVWPAVLLASLYAVTYVGLVPDARCGHIIARLHPSSGRSSSSAVGNLPSHGRRTRRGSHGTSCIPTPPSLPPSSLFFLKNR
jgi:hypothetical protein